MGLVEKLSGQKVNWIQASSQAHAHATDIQPTLMAIDRAERMWGVTPLSVKFRELVTKRGMTIYDRKIEHHFTGSAIILHPATRRVLLTFHPGFQIWQQLGGHDEGEGHPVAVSAREAFEESGIEKLWVCDWPVRIDPHPGQCRTVPGSKANCHYDVCYMSVSPSERFVVSKESLDLRWFSIPEVEQLVKEGSAQQRALEMAENSLALFDELERRGTLPDFQ